MGCHLPLCRVAAAYVVFKTIFEADRKERKAVAEWEAAKAARESIETDSSDGISPPSEKG